MKFLLDHPSFARLDRLAAEETARFEQQLFALLSRAGVLNPAEAAARGARAFRRRINRRFGLGGRYVAH